MEVEDTIPRDPREALITTVQEDTTVIIAMEVEDTIPRDPREAHTARALTLAQMDTCTMGVMMEDTMITDTMVVATIPRVAKEGTVDTTVVIAMEVMEATEVEDTIPREVKEVEEEVTEVATEEAMVVTEEVATEEEAMEVEHTIPREANQ